MPDVLHSGLGPGNGHRTQHWEVANAAARLALSVVESQAGKVCRQLDDNTYYVLRKVAGGVSWARIDSEGAQVSDAAPMAATPTAASAGSSPDASRVDHKHAIPVAAPVAIGAANAAGSADTLARSDHVHALSPADRAKLDASGPSTPLTGAAPAAVTKAAAVVGVSTDAARADHKHDVSTAAPVAIAQANAEGSSASLARADHVHDHGAQPLGTGNQHAVATTTVAGFCSAADKTKLDGIAAGATVGPALSSTTPLAVMNTSGIGVGTTAARHDHYHAHGSHAIGDGTNHAAATTSIAGFMSAADKTKVDAAVAGPASATDNAIARFDLATGKLIQNSVCSISDGGLLTAGSMQSNGDLVVNGNITVTGNVDGVDVSTLSTSVAGKADKEWTVIAHAAASLSITNTHRNALIVANMAGSLPEQNVVIPNDATLNLPIGFTFTLLRDQNWRCSVDWLSGVYAVMDPDRVTYCNAIGSAITCTKIGANRWWITGDLSSDVPDVP